ncbi:MAG: hypothetical protein J2P21_27695, partial [Chloracidobacterium sp.]|nr:hypothetical protein [Chloracidobacterium sp.]
LMLIQCDLSGASERNSSQSFLPLSVSRTFADQSPATCSLFLRRRAESRARPQRETGHQANTKNERKLLAHKFSFPSQALVLQ